MTKFDFKAKVKSYLDKYRFKYDKLVVRQNCNRNIDVWVYFTNKEGFKDKFFVNTWEHTDRDNSVEWYIKQQSFLEGYIDNY